MSNSIFSSSYTTKTDFQSVVGKDKISGENW